MPELVDQIKELNETFTKTLESANAAQAAVSALQGKNADTDETVKKAVEESVKQAGLLQEQKLAINALEKTAEYMEKMIARGHGEDGTSEQKEMEKKAHAETNAYLRHNTPFSPEVSEAICKGLVEGGIPGLDDDRIASEVKTLIAGNNAQGGFYIRPERAAKMIQRIFETSPIRNVADIMSTVSDTVEIVVDDNEAVSGGWVGEVQARTETGTPDIGLLTIPIHEIYAEPKATQKMIEDAGFDIEAWLQGKVTRKMTRDENTAFVTGDGSQKPKGFLSYPAWAAPGTYERGAIEQINSGTDGLVTGDGLKDLQNSLLEEYQSGAIFGMKRAIWGQVIQLKDGESRYLLDTNSLKDGDTMTLLGKSVMFMDDMPAAATNSLSIVYGDFGVGYTIVDRLGFRVLRDPFKDKRYVSFYTTKRTGADVSSYQSLKIQKLAN